MQPTTQRVAQTVQSFLYRNLNRPLYVLFAALFFPVLLTPSLAFAAAPAPDAPRDLSTSGFSHNWSGYAVNSANVTSVTGTWIVPTATATSQELSADASWVGIGGLSTHDLIQAGTQTLFRNGEQSVTAWYEILPDTAHTIAFSVSPGDLITTTIALLPNTTDQWQITLTDATTGQTYTNTLTYTSSQNSAEWIQEMPSTSSGYVPLDQFGTANFINSYVTANNMVQSISQSGGHSITMIKQDRTPLAQVGALTNGTDFAVTRTDALAETTRPALAASGSNSSSSSAQGSNAAQQQVQETFTQTRSHSYTQITHVGKKVVVRVIEVRN